MKRRTDKWREYQRAYTKAWRHRNRDKIKSDRIVYKNKDIVAYRARARASRLRNAGTVKAANKRHYDKRKVRLQHDPAYRVATREYHKQWRNLNPEKYRNEVQRRNARLRERRKIDHVWREQRNLASKVRRQQRLANPEFVTANRKRANDYYHKKKNDPAYKAKRKEHTKKYLSNPDHRKSHNAYTKAWRSNIPLNPKGPKQWLRKNKIELRSVNRLLKNIHPKASPSPREG